MNRREKIESSQALPADFVIPEHHNRLARAPTLSLQHPPMQYQSSNRVTRRLNTRVLLQFAWRRLALQGMQWLLICVAVEAAATPLSPCARAVLTAVPLLFVLLIGGLSCMVAQTVIHACAHAGSFSGSSRLDRLIGNILGSENLINFTSYAVLHVIGHHRHTNGPLDPNHIRPNESWLHYVCHLYFRNLSLAWRFSAAELACYLNGRTNVLDSVPGSPLPHGSRRFIEFCSAHAIAFFIVGSVVIGIVGAWLLRGVQGVCLVFLLWLIPVIFGHILIADFGYRTHVNLPRRVIPYDGADSRSFEKGWVYAILNYFTFDFYASHCVHHFYPKRTIWARCSEPGEGVRQ